MSLLQLLSASQTFMGARSQPGRYRMSGAWRLPRFGSNQETKATIREKLREASTQPRFIVREVDRLANARAINFGRLQRMLRRFVPAFDRKGVVKAPGQRLSEHYVHWNKSQPIKLKGALREPLLDTVCVVRNDLSDDFELVPARKEASKPSTKARRKAGEGAEHSSGRLLKWTGLFARFLGRVNARRK